MAMIRDNRINIIIEEMALPALRRGFIVEIRLNTLEEHPTISFGIFVDENSKCGLYKVINISQDCNITQCEDDLRMCIRRAARDVCIRLQDMKVGFDKGVASSSTISTNMVVTEDDGLRKQLDKRTAEYCSLQKTLNEANRDRDIFKQQRDDIATEHSNLQQELTEAAISSSILQQQVYNLTNRNNSLQKHVESLMQESADRGGLCEDLAVLLGCPRPTLIQGGYAKASKWHREQVLEAVRRLLAERDMLKSAQVSAEHDTGNNKIDS